MSDTKQLPVSYTVLADFIHRANAGDIQASCELRELLDNNPTIWQTTGDLAAHAEAALINSIAGGDEFQKEVFSRTLAEMKAELGIEGAPILERLAIQRITMTWLEVQHLELVLASGTLTTIKGQRHTSTRLDQAHRRHMAAVKSLTMLRKLVPRLQSTRPSSDLKAGKQGAKQQSVTADAPMRVVG